MNGLEREAPRRGRGAATGHFVDHVIKVADSYWPGLFHTYDHPEIPRTTNDIEGFFGSVKHALRTTTGRASTAGSKMDSCGELAIQAAGLIYSLPRAELVERIASVPDQALQSAKRELARIREPARERRSIVRDTKGYLQEVLNRWFAPADG